MINYDEIAQTNKSVGLSSYILYIVLEYSRKHDDNIIRDTNHCSSILHFFINNSLDGHTVKRYTDTGLVTRSTIQLQIEITNNHTIQIDNSLFPVQNFTALCMRTHTHTHTHTQKHTHEKEPEFFRQIINFMS